MSWKYDPTQLASSELYQVRLLIHDTDCNRPLFQDEEIEWMLTQESNIYMTGAMLAEQLVGGQTRGVKQKRVGDLWITYDTAFYARLAANLRARGAGNQVPYAGGISIGDKRTQQEDSDAVQPSVFRNLNENPSTTNPRPPGRNNDDPLNSI